MELNSYWFKHIFLTLCLLASFCLIQACDYESRADIAFFSETKARLQAITYVDDRTIAVSDTAYYRGEWGEGRVILVDVKSKERLGVWHTPIANPQALIASTDSLAVLASGHLVLGQAPQGSWSSLSMLNLNEQKQFELSHELKLQNAPQGVYLVDFARLTTHESQLSFDESWLLSSGIDAVLWKVGFAESADDTVIDMTQDADSDPRAKLNNEGQTKQLNLKAQRYAPSDTLSLASVVQWKEHSLLIDFNQDRLYFVNATGLIEACSPELGRFEDVMEGAQNPYLVDDRLWVVFGLSGRLIHIDLKQLELQLDNPNCEINPMVYSPPLGQIPNDLKVIDDQVYVLHSAESALWTYSVERGERTSQRALPLQSNPWHMALSPSGKQLAISEWLSGSVSLLDIDQESESTRLDSDLFSPPSPAQCYLPLGLNELNDSIQPSSIDQDGIEFRWPEAAWKEFLVPKESDVPSQDLQGVAQLALVVSNNEPLKLEVKTNPNSDWIPLGPLNKRFTIQLNVNDLSNQSLNEDDSNVNHSSWRYDQNYSAEQLGFRVFPQQGLIDDDLKQKIRSKLNDEPCLLFEPKYQALTLDLSVLLKESISRNSQVNSGNEETLSGKVPLYAVRLSIDSAESIQELVAISFRRWP